MEDIKLEQKKDKQFILVSLVLGVVSLINVILFPMKFFSPRPTGTSISIFDLVLIKLFYIIPFFIVIGIFLGFKGLKSSKRKLAIANIFLCVISLVLFLCDILLIYMLIGLDPRFS